MSKDFKVLNDIEHIQLRPGMYIGETTTPLHLVYEVLDNAIDEVINGFATSIKLKIDNDGIEIQDNGRGISNEIMKDKSIPVWATTKLFSGAKFHNSVYNFSIGSHGVGCVVVNALSTSFELHSYNKKTCRKIYCKDGQLVNEEFITDIPKGQSGVFIKFNPSEKYFESLEINLQLIRKRLEFVKAIYPNCSISLNNEDIKSDGLESLVPDNNSIMNTKISYSSKDIKFVFSYDLSKTNNIVDASINLLPVSSGTHINLFLKSIENAWLELTKGSFLEQSDVLIGLRGFIMLNLEKPTYSSQTKTTLTNRVSDLKLIFNEVEKVISKELLKESNHKNFIQPLMRKFEAYRESQNNLASINYLDKIVKYGSIDKSGVSRSIDIRKLYDCTSKNREDTELFIVEGESAGGTLRKARDVKKHAILALRGKVLNVQGLSIDRIFQNVEIKNLINAIGIGVKPKEDISKIRYSKIIIESDSDPDGSSIEALIIGAIAHLIPSVITNGYLYICPAPLYKQSDKFIHNENELDKLKPFRRYKGLGEYNADELKEFSLSNKRTLIQVTGSESEIKLAKGLVGSALLKKELVVNAKLVEI